MLLEIFDGEDLYTRAFLRKSVEAIDWKRVVKHSCCKKQHESEKERRQLVPKWEKWDARRGKGRFAVAVVANSQVRVARKC